MEHHPLKRAKTMNENQRATDVTVRTVNQSDFYTEDVEHFTRGDHGVRFRDHNSKVFVPYENIISVDWGFEEVEEEQVESKEPAEEPTEEQQSVMDFATSVQEDTLEEDYTVSELASEVLPNVEEEDLLNEATNTDGRSTAVDEYEDRLEDLSDEGQ